jgi:hypothetical protein
MSRAERMSHGRIWQLPIMPFLKTYLLSDRVATLKQSYAATAPPCQETLC